MQITDAYRESLPFAQKAAPKSKTNETDSDGEIKLSQRKKVELKSNSGFYHSAWLERNFQHQNLKNSTFTFKKRNILTVSTRTESIQLIKRRDHLTLTFSEGALYPLDNMISTSHICRLLTHYSFSHLVMPLLKGGSHQQAHHAFTITPYPHTALSSSHYLP